MAEQQVVIDVDEHDFQRDVVERSHDVPVVVDFWAAWCGPCRTLGPLLERAVTARGGDVVLAKVDVDRNQRLASMFSVRGIPAVKAFRAGAVVAEFVGAQPPQAIEAFLDRLVPSAADQLVERAAQQHGDEAEATLRQALQIEHGHRDAAVALARLLVERDPDAALDLVAPHRPDPAAEQVAARAELAQVGGDSIDDLRARVAADPDDGGARLALGRALAARSEHDEAIEELLAAVDAGSGVREEAREQLVALFTMLGQQDPRVAAARKRLSRALF
ncbi:MAG: tetratricopeptide repeat protein [Actinobacteria bacterium]|nr:tetratricopeptide repeat protein [Actinomycetota bacterium]